MDYKQYIGDIKMNLESGNMQWRRGDKLLAAGPMSSHRVRHRLLVFTLLLALMVGGLAAMPVPRALAESVPVSIGAVHGSFFYNSNNSGQLDASFLMTPKFTQDFPVIDFNPPGSAQVGCSNSTGVNENTRPFTDVVPNPDGACSTTVAQGGGQQAGLGDLPAGLFAFQATFTTMLRVAAQGQVTFNLFSDDGWMIGAGQRQGGTEQPRYVSGSLLNPLDSTPSQHLPVVGSFNTDSSPAQNQVTVSFPAAGTYPIELDYTECCGGQLSLVLGTTFGNPILPAPSISNPFGNVVDGKPGKLQAWTLGGFDAQHAVTFGEGTSCFLGCPLDNWSATVNWGDSTATSTATVFCLVPPLPGPAPAGPPPVTVHCTIQGSHTYSARGAYPITMALSNSPSTITGEAEITSPPDEGAIKASVGEMVAYDSIGLSSPFIPCTATTILSANKVTVVTAAHCVGDVLNGGHVYSHLKFAPGHTGPTCSALEGCGTNPFGVFQATASDVTIVPNVGNEQRLDWAFIRFAPLAGSRLGQVVPGLAIEFNAPTDSAWRAIGYPCDKQGTGQCKQVGPPGQYRLFYKTCSGSSTTFDGSPQPPGPLQLIMTSCADSGLVQGASGGPWLSPAGAVGTVNKAIGSTGLLGTYFGNEAQAAFLTVSLG